MKIAALVLLFSSSIAAAASDAPPPEALRVLPPITTEAPTITDYLRYQTEMACRQDDERYKSWAHIRTEQGPRKGHEPLRKSLLTMFAGVLAGRTPLTP